MKYIEEYRNPDIVKRLCDRIHRVSKTKVRLMEVCGTHTMSIFRNGIRSLLPATIQLLSGPGCPVCVTSQAEIDTCIELSRIDQVILTTFGDLLRVPGSGSSLQKERSTGKDIRMVYSAMDALEIAQKNPDKHVIFLGIGFETTAPSIAATILEAATKGINNFSVYSAHKRVPPALFALMCQKNIQIDGFILPGHVSVIIGTKSYQPFFETYQIPCVIAGFEATDILEAIYRLVYQIESKTPALENAYPRAVTLNGNLKAIQMMHTLFEESDVVWRGLGIIPKSGLKIRDQYATWNAVERFPVCVTEAESPKGCMCGDILTGTKTPPECPLFKKVCSPTDPVGPCMVSSEGTCAAYYRYFGL